MSRFSIPGRVRGRSSNWIRAGVLGASLAAVAASGSAGAQQLGEGMVRTGTVGIENPTEHQLFHSLLCTCGCPRETLGTCTCGFAHARRSELRTELAAGKSIETIQASYVERFGTEALAVPPNTGSMRALYAVPIGLFLAGGVVVVVALRRWRKRGGGDGDPPAGGAAGGKRSGGKGKPPPRDAYDEKLDDELKRLDDE
jgi:cytochrome c-type biogenesis protein CcmH